MANDISNSDDVIDSRDVIERIEELQLLKDEGEEVGHPFTQEDAEELKALLALQEEAAPYAADWQHGTTLIRDSYFCDYAEQLADDIGALPDGLSWPLSCIDWEKAARELQQDYTSVDFDGVTYWVR